MHRRAFITLIGGGAVFAASGCASADVDARAAWAEAPTRTDPRLFALGHAILAPNPHNRQPWTVRLDGDDGLTLFVDRARLLPVTDPFSRQIVVGCGAFLELLSLAASAKGLRAEITSWPDGEPGDRLDPKPVAAVRLVPTTAKRDPLFDHILARRSNKQAYDPAVTPSAEQLGALGRASQRDGVRFASTTAPDAVGALRDMAKRAWYREMDTPAAMQESARLTRIGAREIAADPDGISLDGPMMETLGAVGILTRESMATPGSIAFNEGKKMIATQVDSANAFAWLIGRDNGRSTQIEAGRAYARLNLAATGAGLAVHPHSQALQEFPEMAALKSEADRLTGVRDGERLQMFVRVGVGPQEKPSPRRGLDAHLIA